MKLNSEKKFDSIFSDDRFLCTVAAAIIGSAVVGGVLSSNSSSKAADTQLQASQDATATQRDMFNTVNKQQEPWRQAGSNALSSISNGFGLSVPTGDYNQQVGGVGRGQFNHSFDANDLKTNLAPNYDFQLQQGLGAVNNQASVTGGLVGGNALKGINDYAQGYAGNAYQQAFNNYNTNQTNIYNRLSNIAGLGQTANGQTAQAGTTIAGNISSAQMAGGAAQAAGIVGSNNALVGGMNNAVGMFGANNLTGGRLFSGGGAPDATTGGGANAAQGFNLYN